MSNQKCPDCGQEIPESSMAHSCPGPAKAEQANRRERFANTTFRAMPHAQTPEGMLEAKDAEIAALRAKNAEAHKQWEDLFSKAVRLERQRDALRAECARNARAQAIARVALHKIATGLWSAEKAAEIANAAQADITKILSEP